MTEKKSKTFAWQRKLKNSENIHTGLSHVAKALLLSLGLLSALLITIILTFHTEISLVLRNVLYGEPIIIKKPISIIKNVPVFYKDSLASSPISIDVPSGSMPDSENSQDTIPQPKSNVTQVGQYTYQVRIGSDERMATPVEIADALNAYRKDHNRSALEWNNKLATYAHSRAKYFYENEILDEHEGFRKYVNNEGGFERLGFDSLGENSAYLSGGELMAKTIIEQLFASDIYHDNNQLDDKWTHVGVGIEGLAINVIFGGNMIK